MRLLVLVIALLPATTVELHAATTVARTTRETGCEIIDYGLYVPESRRVRYADAGSVTGERFEITQVRFTKQTKSIAATLGQRFGIRYRLRNLSQPAVVVTWRVVYPSPVRSAKRWEYSFKSVPDGGELVQHLLYQFDVGSEMVTGRWDFQVLVDGAPHCSFAFQVQ